MPTDSLLHARFSDSRSNNGSTPSVRHSVCLSATLLGWLVCVICYSKSFCSFFQTLYNDWSHIEDVHLFVLILLFFSCFRGDELYNIYLSKMLRGGLVCVICNSQSFHSFDAPNFEKAEGACCFRLVPASVRPLQNWLRYSFEISYVDSSLKIIDTYFLSLDYPPLWSYVPLKEHNEIL